MENFCWRRTPPSGGGRTTVGKRSAKAKGNPVYLRHKFLGIGVDEVNERIDRLRAALGRFDGFSAEEIMPDLFRIAGRPSDRPAVR